LEIVLLKTLDRRTLSQPSVTVQLLEYVLPVLSEAQSVERVKYLLPNKPLRTLQLLLVLPQESHSFAAATVDSDFVGASPAKTVTAKLDKISAKNSLIFSP
jgi:lipid A disaccharide synthetase